jgi:site-specific DNA-cytosine methylase
VTALRVLVACEFTAAVRDAFRALGHDAWSCDTEPTEGDPAWHIHDDVRTVLQPGRWDLLIGFPPCTDLAASGARHWAAKRADGRQAAAVEFVRLLADAPVPRVAIENPVGHLSSAWRKPDQIIQPWQHGHGHTKATCLWLRGLPLLEPSDVVDGRVSAIHLMPDSLGRQRRRSRTYTGVAAAMAAQWGGRA